MSHALDEQNGSHDAIFKFVTNAKFTVFMLGYSAANTVFK